MILRSRSVPAIRRRSAFTLLEVLTVVAIILVLASVATVAVLNILEENKDDTAKMNAVNLEKSVKTYMIKNPDAAPPQNIQDILQYVDGHDQNKLIDPWGTPYMIGYNESGSPYVYCTNPKTGALIRSDTSNRTK